MSSGLSRPGFDAASGRARLLHEGCRRRTPARLLKAVAVRAAPTRPGLRRRPTDSVGGWSGLRQSLWQLVGTRPLRTGKRCRSDLCAAPSTAGCATSGTNVSALGRIVDGRSPERSEARVSLARRSPGAEILRAGVGERSLRVGVLPGLRQIPGDGGFDGHRRRARRRRALSDAPRISWSFAATSGRS